MTRRRDFYTGGSGPINWNAVLADAQDGGQVDQIQQVIDTLRTDDTQVPSADAVLRALKILQPHRSEPLADWLGPIRILARLVFDSRNGPALPGYRGEASS